MTNSKMDCLKQVIALSVAALMTLAIVPPISRAASHREAPLIALDPAADNTDTYAFRSWQDPKKVAFIMRCCSVWWSLGRILRVSIWSV